MEVENAGITIEWKEQRENKRVIGEQEKIIISI
jgi:hypothetical protein